MRDGDDLMQVERAVVATAAGDLTEGRWPHDCATALGMAGRRNPLGFALVRYLSDTPSAANAMAVVLALSTELIRQKGIPGEQANSLAWQALQVWNDQRCPRCGGRGVVANGAGAACQPCSGTGFKGLDWLADIVKDAVGVLESHAVWIDRQLASRLRKNG